MANANSKRIVLYLRASSEEQTESIDAQRDLLERYAEDHNWEIVDEYEDFAKSGDTCKSRDGLQLLMDDAKSGKFDGVLVRQLSRLSRRNSLKSAEQIINPLLDAGVTIHTVSHGNLELTSATGRIMFAVLSEFDHTENVSRSLNIINGQSKAAKAGSWQGAPPYAYKIEGEKHNKRLLLGDATKVENVRRMFTMYDEGETAVSIAKILNEEGHPSPHDNRWRTNTIYAILERPVYVGDHRWNYKSRGKYYEDKGGKPVERSDHWLDSDQEKARSTINDPDDWITHPDHWPSIVSRELWDRVQRRRKNNVLCRPKKSSAPYKLSGLLRCGCGAKMNGKSPASRRKYQCTKCNSWADEGDLLNAVASAVMDKLTPAHLDKLRQVIARKVKQPPQPKTDVKSLEQQLEKQKRNRLALDVPDPEQFRDAVRAIEAEIRRLEREIALAKRETQQRRQSDPDRLVEQAMGRLKVLPAGDDQQVKAFLQTSVDHVDVWTEKTGSGNKTRYSLARGEIHFVSPTEQDLSR